MGSLLIAPRVSVVIAGVAEPGPHRVVDVQHVAVLGPRVLVRHQERGAGRLVVTDQVGAVLLGFFFQYIFTPVLPNLRTI